MSTKLLIKNLRYETKNTRIIGRVLRKYPLKEMRNGNHLLSFRIQDISAAIQVVSFGKDAEKFHSLFKQNDIVELKNFCVRRSQSKQGEIYEIHLNKVSELNIIKPECAIEFVPKVETIPLDIENLGEDAKNYDQTFSLEGQLIFYEWSVILYDGCTKCKKRVSETCSGTKCENNKSKIKQLIVNAELVKSSVSVRVTFFHDIAMKFLELDEKNLNIQEIKDKCDKIHGSQVNLLVAYGGLDNKENPKFNVNGRL